MAIRPESLILPLKLLANDDVLLCVGVSQKRGYEDNKITDRIVGHAYECVAIKAKYEKITVTIPDLPPIFTNDDLTVEIFIRFEEFSARFYKDRNGLYMLSCKAKEAFIV